MPLPVSVPWLSKNAIPQPSAWWPVQPPRCEKTLGYPGGSVIVDALYLVAFAIAFEQARILLGNVERFEQAHLLFVRQRGQRVDTAIQHRRRAALVAP